MNFNIIIVFVICAFYLAQKISCEEDITLLKNLLAKIVASTNSSSDTTIVPTTGFASTTTTASSTSSTTTVPSTSTTTVPPTTVATTLTSSTLSTTIVTSPATTSAVLETSTVLVPPLPQPLLIRQRFPLRLMYQQYIVLFPLRVLTPQPLTVSIDYFLLS